MTSDGLDYLARALRVFRDGKDGRRLPVFAEQILFHLAQQPQGSAGMGELRRYLGLQSQRASRICARLRTAGVIAIDLASYDRRVALVRLTPKGRALIDKSLAVSGAKH